MRHVRKSACRCPERPELVNISVGSLPGTSGLDATTVWALEAKKSRKVLRMSATLIAEWVMAIKAQAVMGKGCLPLQHQSVIRHSHPLSPHRHLGLIFCTGDVAPGRLLLVQWPSVGYSTNMLVVTTETRWTNQSI